MYILSLVVWAVVGTAPIVDTTKTFKTFEECEEYRIHHNTMYELELQKGSIQGYETGCSPRFVK